MSKEVEEIDEEIVILEDRGGKIENLIQLLLSGEKHLSYSALKAFKSSPSDYIQYVFRERKTTEAMLFGTMVHCLVLEPTQFKERYFVIDDIEIIVQIGGAKPRSTNKYKEWLTAQIEANPGKLLVTFKDHLFAQNIASGVLQNRASSFVLNLCPKRELQVEWKHKNFKHRGILDLRGERCIADLKTCADAEPKRFQRDLINMGYHIQGAMYLTAIGEDLPYYIIAADKKGGVSVHRLHDSLIEYGMREYERLLDAFNGCILKDNFDQSHDFYSEQYNGYFIAEKPSYLY